MNREDIIRMAEASGVEDSLLYEHWRCNLESMTRFAALVASAEREAISDEWWSCYQADLENGVKSLNEYEAMKFATNYPELAKFGKWLDSRGQA